MRSGSTIDPADCMKESQDNLSEVAIPLEDGNSIYRIESSTYDFFAVNKAVDAVKSEKFMFGSLESGDTGGIVFVLNRWLWLKMRDNGKISEKHSVNPWDAILEFEKVIDIMLCEQDATSARFRLVPIPPLAAEGFPQLVELMSLPKAAIEDRMIDHLRHGGSYSGGPYTGETWEIWGGKEGFWISSSREEGASKRPISEAEIRDMFRMEMFGLQHHPEEKA